MSSGIADIVPASSEPRLCQQSRPSIDLQCASRSRHATVVLAACMSPVYHQTREQLRPDNAIGFHSVLHCSNIQSQRLTSRPMSLGVVFCKVKSLLPTHLIPQVLQVPPDFDA